MRSLRSRLSLLTALLASGGAILQLGSCTPGGAIRLVGQTNPCGLILNCDPRAYEFIRSGIDGPGVSNADPFCTFPPFCTAAQDPIFGGLGGAGGP